MASPIHTQTDEALKLLSNKNSGQDTKVRTIVIVVVRTAQNAKNLFLQLFLPLSFR